MRLKDKVALITGGGSGIGRASAILFGREGARVVVADVKEGPALATSNDVEAQGADSTISIGDVTDSADAARMVLAAVETYGRLDVVVNSAGITARNALPAGASEEDVWDRVIDVNLKGTYLVSKHAVDQMTKTGGGAIVNLASVMGLVAYPPGLGGGFSPYQPSKGGVIQLTRNLGVNLAADNIRVNCICPGYIWTDMTESLTKDPDTARRLESLHPMGRLGQPEDIANAALFLASDDSSYMTGSYLAVDGGYTAQ